MLDPLITALPLDLPLGLSFDRPWLLVLLVGLPVYLWARARITGTAVAFAPRQLWDPASSSGRGSSRWMRGMRGMRGLLDALFYAGVVVALAGPHLEDSFESVSEEGIDLALVLDISASMQAEDIRPNRLEALKDLAQNLAQRSSGNRIGVFVFAKHVFTQTPLTTDADLLAQLVGELSYETIRHAESGGTALGDALLVANDALERQRVEGREQMIVAFTDGESHEGIDPLLAARAVRESGVALQVIGIGRTEPVPVFVYGKPFINVNDQQLETQLQEEQLIEVAAAAGGVYRHAESLDVLQAVFADLEQLTAAPLEVRRRVLRHSLVPTLAPVLLLLFLGWVVLESRTLRSPLR